MKPVCDRILAILFGLLSVCWVSVSLADTVSAQHPPENSLGLHSSYFKEAGPGLTISDAITAYDSGKFHPGDTPVLDFGIGSRPVWIQFDVDNRSGKSLLRRLSIETSWLDKVDLYFRSGNKVIASDRMGDALKFAQRPIDSRFFEVDHGFDPGITEVFIRVETSDPMVVPVHLRTPEAATSFDRRQAYSYGFVYGFLFALLGYNAILYIGLRSRRYIFYAVYLATFALLNIAYTGHGFAWLWPDRVGLELWIIPFLMVLTGITGLQFAASFLDTTNNFPRLHRIVIWTCALFVLLLPETNLDAAIALAERLRTLISGMRLSYQGKEIRFTASFGVVQRTAQCLSMDEIISAADDRLYQSKREGRNRVSHA
ncbi:MAG TPA: diguanylate cyclase [Gallionella sp.]|nr:diguanylate cyclase [Gallionella sp.]